MPVHEWIFSGIGPWIFDKILPFLFKDKRKKCREQELAEKQIKALDIVLEDQRKEALPDIQYGQLYLFNKAGGILRIEVINTGQLGYIVDIAPQFSSWKYTGPDLPLTLRHNQSEVLTFRIPLSKTQLDLPENYKIYLRVNDFQNRLYEAAIIVSPRGITTTPPVLISR